MGPPQDPDRVRPGPDRLGPGDIGEDADEVDGVLVAFGPEEGVLRAATVRYEVGAGDPDTLLGGDNNLVVH